jgi:hypothetical protein
VAAVAGRIPLGSNISLISSPTSKFEMLLVSTIVVPDYAKVMD